MGKNLIFVKKNTIDNYLMDASKSNNKNILYNMNPPPPNETEEILLLREYINTTGKSPYLRVKKQETIDIAGNER